MTKSHTIIVCLKKQIEKISCEIKGKNVWG